MKIGIYSKDTDRDLLHNINNLLIINSVFGWQPSPEVIVFYRGAGVKLNDLPPPVQHFPLVDNTTRWWSALAGQRQVLSRLLKKKDIDALLLFDIKEVVNTDVPQFLLLNDQYETVKKDIPLFQKLTGIAVSSEKIKTRLIAEARVDPQRVTVTAAIMSEGLGATDSAGKDRFKESVTDGKEFFICADDQWTPASLVLVLKAFSRFKKMQQTNWKLVLTHRGLNPETAFGSAFGVISSYKYKDDIVLFGQSASCTYAQALGAAYAAISTKTDGGFPVAVAEALRCGTTTLVPDASIESSFPALPAYLAGDEASLGTKMMELYKNEVLRQYYIEAIVRHTLLNTSKNGLEALLGRR